jgi:hypothetical protein
MAHASGRHSGAFGAIGGIPHQILYDRTKTAGLGEAGGSIVYNRALIDFARHYGFQAKACVISAKTSSSCALGGKAIGKQSPAEG